jgi:CubicO group peptidase (beta-lactamase class C family)
MIKVLLLIFCIGPLFIDAQIAMEKFKNLEAELLNQFGKDYSWSVLIQMDNDIAFEKDFIQNSGTSNDETIEKRLFNIASISKAITAVGVLKLLEQNKIRLEDKLVVYFPDIPNDKAEISILDLLVHQSGLTQTYPCNGISSSEKALATIMKEKLISEPGVEFHYTNQNYQLLALIIENVSGQAYESYIKEYVLEALDMDHTLFWEEAANSDSIAKLPRNIRRAIGKRNWGYIGSTGMFSNSIDLLHFWTGIKNTDFLSEKSKEMLFRSHHSHHSGLGIGFGFYNYPETDWNTPEIWTRGTESWGHNAVIRNFPDKNLTIIVLSNSGEIGKNRLTGNRMISDYIANFILD